MSRYKGCVGVDSTRFGVCAIAREISRGEERQRGKNFQRVPRSNASTYEHGRFVFRACVIARVWWLCKTPERSQLVVLKSVLSDPALRPLHSRPGSSHRSQLPLGAGEQLQGL